MNQSKDLRRNPLHTGEEAYMQGIHSGFKAQDRCHQKSKSGVSVAYKKDWCRPKIKKKTFNICKSGNLNNVLQKENKFRSSEIGGGFPYIVKRFLTTMLL